MRRQNVSLYETYGHYFFRGFFNHMANANMISILKKASVRQLTTVRKHDEIWKQRMHFLNTTFVEK